MKDKHKTVREILAAVDEKEKEASALKRELRKSIEIREMWLAAFDCGGPVKFHRRGKMAPHPSRETLVYRAWFTRPDDAFFPLTAEQYEHFTGEKAHPDYEEEPNGQD